MQQQGAGSSAVTGVQAPSPEFSVVMPCLNEVATLGACIQKARGSLDSLGVDGEIVVADNGSTDGGAGRGGAGRRRGRGARPRGGRRAAGRRRPFLVPPPPPSLFRRRGRPAGGGGGGGGAGRGGGKGAGGGATGDGSLHCRRRRP